MGIKKRVIRGNAYYYLEKNIRIGESNWKTFYIYLGSAKPLVKELKKYEKILAKKIDIFLRNHVIKPGTEFIDSKTALLLERIKTSNSKILSKLSKDKRNAHIKTQREAFITNTNAIEGSRLTLDQTKRILELKKEYNSKDREEIEVINMGKCLELYDEMLNKKIDLKEEKILYLHLILLKAIPDYESYTGTWRPVNVYIRGSKYEFPHWKEVPKMVKELLSWYVENKNRIHPVELAAKFHSKFVTIHPFADGNGRMARLLLNYILELNGFPFVDIPFSKRDEYFKTQEEGHFGKYNSFVNFLVEEIKKQFKDLKKEFRKKN
ncbi:MAG: Fic family protein [Candidatus Micrarchaeota archaeon]